MAARRLLSCPDHAAGRAQAQSVEDFYRGKQIRLIVSFDVGNDYDQWARLLARHLGRHLPGNPTFVVQNMPAAGGIASANFLYNVAPKDGTVIGMIGRNLPYHALVQESGVQYDPDEVQLARQPRGHQPRLRGGRPRAGEEGRGPVTSASCWSAAPAPAPRSARRRCCSPACSG